MAVPAAPPVADPSRAAPGANPPPLQRRPVGSRGRRPGRVAGAVLATVAGVAVLAAGWLRTPAGGPASTADPSASPGRIGVLSASPDSAPASASAGSSSGATPVPPSLDPNPPPTVSPVTGAGGPIVEARLQATLDALRTKLGIPGISVTVLFPDGHPWTGVSGLAVVRAKTPVTPDTAFAFASISKTFTSAVILQLADEGKLRLSDPAAGLLPALRLTIDRRITVGMLLNHTSGLADYFLNPKIDGPLQKVPTAIWSVDRTLGYVGKRLSPPGRAWHYSNTNYLLLGLIAERLTGQPLAEAIRTRLLEPTGLGASWYQVAETARDPLAHGYRLAGTKPTARAVDLSDGTGVAPFRSVVSAAGGAGSIAGTSADLAQWARALYTGKVLGPTGTATLLSGFSKTTGYLPGVSYGYGIQAFSIDGHPSLGHSGRLLGFRSVVRHFPLNGLTIAVLTNQSRADPAVVVRALLAVILPPPVAPPPSAGPGASGTLPGASGAPPSASGTLP